MCFCKCRVNPDRRKDVKGWGFNPRILSDIPNVMPAIPTPEIVSQSGIRADIHDNMPLSIGISLGVISMPVDRWFRRGTPTSAVNTPLACDRDCRSYDTGPLHG
ncbi:hypothetical protein D3C73_635280 [compost metagenome]